MTEVLDGGPVYQSMDVSLDGSVADIFSRIAFIVDSIIVSICKNTPNPINQTGDVVSFKRLSYKDNELHSEFSINELYDRIRMVDGLNYPRAYICFGKYNIELSEAVLADNTLFAKIKILPRI
jgi:methionyl-tRNA formyltransferase